MSARTRQRWLIWLLPLIVLRAFVPAGFMLSAAGGELSLMLCSGAGPAITQQTAAPVVADYSAHAHYADHANPAIASSGGHHDHEGSQAHENSVCPFVLGGSSNAPLALPMFATIAPIVVSGFDFFNEPEFRSAPLLNDRIRGPPLV